MAIQKLTLAFALCLPLTAFSDSSLLVSCKLPANTNLGIEKEIPVSLSKDEDATFKVVLGKPAQVFKGLKKESVEDRQALELMVGHFSEALYVADVSKIKSAEVYSSSEESEQEIRVFKFVDEKQKLITWAVLIDGIGSGCK